MEITKKRAATDATRGAARRGAARKKHLAKKTFKQCPLRLLVFQQRPAAVPTTRRPIDASSHFRSEGGCEARHAAGCLHAKAHREHVTGLAVLGVHPKAATRVRGLGGLSCSQAAPNLTLAAS